MIKLFILLFFITTIVKAQFPGPVSSNGTTAIHKDSNIFVNWATTCLVTRGYQDIANTSNGYATAGNDTNGTKKASINSIVSLGDAGSAILTFQSPITNGVGFDFAVFENSFNDVFLELAFVEVSSDGFNYFRFPASSNTQTLTQIGPFDNTGDATKLNNLAGKYRANYGTPFDLQEMAAHVGLDIDAITHVKIIDVVGAINVPYATYDNNNNVINDPYPTAFGSGGFDLDAVGVINQLPVGVKEKQNIDSSINIYPNPTYEFIDIYSNNLVIKEVYLTDINGRLIIQSNQSRLLLGNIESGIYLLKIINNKGETITKKIIKN